MPKRKCWLSWSSGKDSAWTLHAAREQGEFEVTALLTTVTDGHDRVSMHAVREELLDLGSAYPRTTDIRTVLFHPAFPVDVRHNAKIFREKLADWAAKQRLGAHSP